MQITINEKDLKKYNLTHSPSGRVICELAYASKEWTEDDLSNNNFEYEPYEPYYFNFEDDLLANTKTQKQFLTLWHELQGQPIDIDFKNTKLQAGAFVALYHTEIWNNLLKQYEIKVKEDRTDSISKAYNEQLQEEIDSFWSQMNKEWLYGDHRDYIGVIKSIAKYWEAEEGHYDQNTDEYTFTFDEDYAKETLEEYNGKKLTQKAFKEYLLEQIKDSSEVQQRKHEEEREKRKAERERLSKIKAEQKAKAEQERKEKLLKLKLK